MLGIIVGVILIVIVLIWTITGYNTFITLLERVNNSKAQIATQIESRWDAVANLIQATKQYAAYEVDALERLTDKRVSMSGQSSIADLEKGDAQLNEVVGRLIAISENYPDLKTSDVYKQSMASIEKFEDHVRSARMIYNDTVTKYNRQLKMFPSNVIATIFQFSEQEYFQATEAKLAMPSWEASE